MPISDAQFVAWLSQEHAERVVLYEQDYMYEESDGSPSQGTLYLSDRPYMPLDAELPYVECISSVPEFTRSLGGNRLDTYSSSIGSVEIINTDGEFDFLLDLAIDGSEARFYFGDISWARSDFRLIFSVLGLRVQRAPFRRLTIDLRDSLALLNQSVGGTSQVGGVGPYANNARPLNVGFIHNLTPLSLDSINLTYVHSDSIFATAIEVRDDGIPVSFTDNGDGTLELNASPAGLITCDVDSITAANQRTVSDTFDRLVGARGGFSAAGLYFGPHPTFVIDDVDDYPIGMSIGDARNIIDLLADLTESANCFAAIRRDGQFTYGRLKPYDIASFGLDPVNIVEDDIVPRTAFDLEHLTPEYYQYQAYAHKNWTVQSSLSAILNPDEQARFQRKGQYALQQLVGGLTYADAPELYHKTLSVSPPIETLISIEDDADIVALTQWMETRRAMFLPWLEIATVSLPLGANPDEPAMFYALELGDVTRVTLPRFGYDAGVLFQAISVGINLSKARVAIRMVRKRGISAPPIGWQTIEQYIIQTPLQYRLGPPTVQVVATLPPTAPPIGPPIVIVQPTPAGLLLYSFQEQAGVNAGNPPSSLTTIWFFADTHTPLWYEEDPGDPQLLLIYGDEASGTVSDLDLLTRAQISDVAYPAYFLAPTTGPDAVLLLEDSTTISHPLNVSIDYAASPKAVAGLQVPVVALMPDFNLGFFEVQYWLDYDYDFPTVAFSAVFLAEMNLGTGTGFPPILGHLLLTIQNKSGSTLTGIDAGAGTNIIIALPEAADPTNVLDGEVDVSFVGGAPTCVVHNAGSLTLTVSGDQHTLNFKFSVASLGDDTKTQFVFPIEIQIGDTPGFYGTPGAGQNIAHITPIILTALPVTTPAATVRTFTDASPDVGFTVS